jgi:superfamily II DNA or RNA helicase
VTTRQTNASQLRPYQADVIARIDAKIAEGFRRILLVAPTGAGKTVIAAAIIAATVQPAPAEPAQQ